jgi:hypothetical protein
LILNNLQWLLMKWPNICQLCMVLPMLCETHYRRIKIIKKIYIKHINLLYKLATCFDPYRVIIRPSYWIMLLKHCVHYWDSN